MCQHGNASSWPGRPVCNMADRMHPSCQVCCYCCCRLQWYIENNNTVTWPFDLAADQLRRRLSKPKVEAPFGPGEPAQCRVVW